MIIECVDAAGFEDQIGRSKDGYYQVEDIGENGYLIKNDNWESRWYGAYHFKIVW